MNVNTGAELKPGDVSRETEIFADGLVPRKFSIYLNGDIRAHMHAHKERRTDPRVSDCNQLTDFPTHVAPSRFAADISASEIFIP